jgi:hypothetical protein
MSLHQVVGPSDWYCRPFKVMLPPNKLIGVLGHSVINGRSPNPYVDANSESSLHTPPNLCFTTLPSCLATHQWMPPSTIQSKTTQRLPSMIVQIGQPQGHTCSLQTTQINANFAQAITIKAICDCSPLV